MRFGFAAAVAFFFFCAPASAQFFRNNALHLAVGWQGMGSTFDAIVGDQLWNINDQGTVGAGYTTALGYELWGDAGASIGLSSVRINTAADFQPIIALNTWGGIRYNFLTERVRPFVSVAGDLLTIVLASPDIPNNELFGIPFWAGARLGGGLEYFFLDDQSLMLDAQAVAFIGANTPPPGGIASPVLPATSVRIVYHVYF